MPNSTLGALTAATAAAGGLFYGTQSGADRKFTFTAAGATLIEAADAAAQRTALAILPLTGGTLTGALINSTNGAASTPVVSLTGTTFTGGSATTTKPTLLVEPTGTTSTGWSTAGSLIGANAATGFTGRLIDCQLAGVSKFSVSSAGFVKITASSSAATPALGVTDSGDTGWFSPSNGIIYYGGSSRGVQFGLVKNGNGTVQLAYNGRLEWTAGAADSGTLDTFLSRSAAATLQMGVNAASGLNQTIKACDGTAGSGADLILAGGTGTTTNGNVRFGTYTNTISAITGYITIKDEGGTTRRLAVVA